MYYYMQTFLLGMTTYYQLIVNSYQLIVNNFINLLQMKVESRRRQQNT